MSDHRFFIDSTLTGEAIRELPSTRWDPTFPADIRYPYDVIEAALPQITARGLHFYFTRDAYWLPEYGRHVVSILVQEERCKVPVYGHHVCATVRNLFSHPFIGFGPHAHMSHLEAVLMFEYARDWYTHLRSLMAQRHRSQTEPGDIVQKTPVLIQVPLGYHSQEELPQVPMEERSVDVFFAGQIRHDLPRSDYRYWVSTSKFVAREQLWRELNRLEALGQWNIDRGNIAGTDRASHADQFNTYSHKMMNSRVCVAPRGSVAESYRAFEGARAGCLVVANRLPNRSYLSSAPFIQVDHWRELEDILLKYGRNLDLLERARAATLAWWKNHIAVDRVGTYVAQHINQAWAAATGN